MAEVVAAGQLATAWHRRWRVGRCRRAFFRSAGCASSDRRCSGESRRRGDRECRRATSFRAWRRAFRWLARRRFAARGRAGRTDCSAREIWAAGRRACSRSRRIWDRIRSARAAASRSSSDSSSGTVSEPRRFSISALVYLTTAWASPRMRSGCFRPDFLDFS